MSAGNKTHFSGCRKGAGTVHGVRPMHAAFPVLLRATALTYKKQKKGQMPLWLTNKKPQPPIQKQLGLAVVKQQPNKVTLGPGVMRQQSLYLYPSSYIMHTATQHQLTVKAAPLLLLVQLYHRMR